MNHDSFGSLTQVIKITRESRISGIYIASSEPTSLRADTGNTRHCSSQAAMLETPIDREPAPETQQTQ